MIGAGDQLERGARIGDRDRQRPAVGERRVEAQELAGIALRPGGNLRDGRVDRLLAFRIGGDEAPGRRARIVGAAVALRRQPLEAEAQPRHVLLRAERDGKSGERAVGHLDQRGGAILRLDRIHARRRPREDAADRPEHVGQEIVVVDRVGDEAAAELGRPAAAPGIGVVFRQPPPVRLDRRRIGFSGEALVAQMQELRDAVGEAVLEDRADALAGPALELGQRVRLGERAGERLLDDDVMPGAQRLPRLLVVQAGGRADIDDVEVAARNASKSVSAPGTPYSPAVFAARSASMSQRASTE